MNILTEDNFDELYEAQENHLDDNASWSGQMYETYGEELEYVLNTPSNRVWTIVENDGKTSVIAGYHIVNRMGYLITKNAWETGVESFDIEEVDEPLCYTFYKEDFSDREFYDLISFQYGLPEFCDIFDRDGEVVDEYRPYFSEGASVEVLHENLRITDENVLQKFLLDYANTTNSMDEAIKHRIRPIFQLGGDGDGLGFILDVWLSLEDMQDGEEPNDMFTFWFEDYEDD